MEELVMQAIEKCSGLPDGLTLILISMMPMFGIRGGMAASYFLQTPVIKAVFFCVLGNFIPVPFIFLFGRFLKDRFKKYGIFKKTIAKIEEKAEKNKGMIEKYGFFGIILFIALPLPGTGSYMGTFIASLSSMTAKRAFSAVVCGMLLSGAVMGSLVSLFY